MRRQRRQAPGLLLLGRGSGGLVSGGGGLFYYRSIFSGFGDSLIGSWGKQAGRRRRPRARPPTPAPSTSPASSVPTDSSASSAPTAIPTDAPATGGTSLAPSLARCQTSWASPLAGGRDAGMVHSSLDCGAPEPEDRSSFGERESEAADDGCDRRERVDVRAGPFDPDCEQHDRAHNPPRCHHKVRPERRAIPDESSG